MLCDLTSGTNSVPGLGVLEPQGAAFSADGRLLAVCNALGSTTLFEFPSFHEVASMHGFLLGVHSVAFSPDAKRLAAGSNAKEALKLWDVNSRQELLTLEGQGSRLHATSFSPDGNALGSLSDQGQLQIWRAPSWAEIEAAEKN